MIICNMESAAVARSVRSKGSSQGFRLVEEDGGGDTGSVYSVYKQRIDQMFESDSSTATKNSVQARIEKMFTDVAQDVIAPEFGQQHNFSVDYLGSVPLLDKVSSLAGLQLPLKQLYFAYKRTTNSSKPLAGRLEISNRGLRVQYQGEKGDLEQLNSFPTIAVWSAVKFVINDWNSYAFLPLITDPDNIDKKTLFQPLDDHEKTYITQEAHSPLFAVVMRKIGVHKQLECHGFVCQTSEDAIVVAATLYKSLMAHMKAKEKKPKSRNGITCMSIASSVANEKTSRQHTPVRPPRKKRSTTSSIVSGGGGGGGGDNDRPEENWANEIDHCSDTQPLLLLAKKTPPKKSTKTRRAPKAPNTTAKPEDLDAILPYEEPIAIDDDDKPKTFSEKINTFMSKEQKQITDEIKQVISGGGKFKQDENENSSLRKKKDNTGDILTKVTIPRSGSFLNAGGLTRYKSKITRSNGQATGGSPLGFNELFNEFRLQEGLHSMDEILGVIIDPEGMSFNDLKPIYKEFLLKLSVTLTKDELYQRSKSIMRRQRKKLLRRSVSAPQKSHHILVGNKFKRLKHIFQKNLKMRLGKTDVDSGGGGGGGGGGSTQIGQQPVAKTVESSISTSSYDTRQFSPKEKTKKKEQRMSTSEESDFFSVRRRTKTAAAAAAAAGFTQNRNSSSGYVSCSECSYDSDSCTCISADKCYCSLKHAPKEEKFCCGTEAVFCGCDTDSCTESNKCYCQLRTGDERHHRRLCQQNSNTRSTRSLEYMHNPTEAYYEKVKGHKKRRRYSDNLALDYELFKIQQNLDNRSLYSRAINDGIHKQASIRSYSSIKYAARGASGRGLKTMAAPPCMEALSVKKSAEIAALFADIKLSQTTDVAIDVEAVLARNAYNLRKGHHDTKAVASLYGHVKPAPPALYRNSKNLYNSHNGLYTIQSQSDESRRSSVSEGRTKNDYFKLETNFGQAAGDGGVPANLENSLGYLP